MSQKSPLLEPVAIGKAHLLLLHGLGSVLPVLGSLIITATATAAAVSIVRARSVTLVPALALVTLRVRIRIRARVCALQVRILVRASVRVHVLVSEAAGALATVLLAELREQGVEVRDRRLLLLVLHGGWRSVGRRVVHGGLTLLLLLVEDV